MDMDLVLPEKLSPSRVKDFMQCPRLFYYKAMLKMSTPPTEATAKGTVAHYAFEHIFNHPREARTPDLAVSYIAPAWEMMLNPYRSRDEVTAGSPEALLRDAEGGWSDLVDEESSAYRRAMSTAASYQALIDDGTIDNAAFLDGVEVVVRAWFQMENPTKFDPHSREEYVIADVSGTTVHGFIDRLDIVKSPAGERLYVSDYKTGKKPNPRYEDHAFFQLEVYALLLKEQKGLDTYQLRLIYVKEGRPDAVLTRLVTPAVLAKTRTKLQSVSKAMKSAHKSGEWPTKKQTLCDWCFFQDICPAFRPELEGLLPAEISARLY